MVWQAVLVCMFAPGRSLHCRTRASCTRDMPGLMHSSARSPDSVLLLLCPYNAGLVRQCHLQAHPCTIGCAPAAAVGAGLHLLGQPPSTAHGSTQPHPSPGRYLAWQSASLGGCQVQGMLLHARCQGQALMCSVTTAQPAMTGWLMKRVALTCLCLCTSTHQPRAVADAQGLAQTSHRSSSSRTVCQRPAGFSCPVGVVPWVLVALLLAA